jgi:hypothetical protein
MHIICRWIDYRLAKALKRVTSPEDRESKLEYLSDALQKAKQFHDFIRRNPTDKVPFSVLTSEKWPTPTRIKVSSKGSLLHPCFFESGDGVVTNQDSMMPPGYTFKKVLTKHSHIGMMNDIRAVANSLRQLGVFVHK